MARLPAIAFGGLLLLSVTQLALAPVQANTPDLDVSRRIEDAGSIDGNRTVPSRHRKRLIKVAQNGSGQAPRTALVVGNATYPDDITPLRHPVRDARLLIEELKRLDFDVVGGEDLPRQKLQAAIAGFKAKIKPGSTALLYFSGYAIQLARQSYIIPVDAHIWTEAEVRRVGVSIDSILAGMADAGARVRLAIIDASRRNPFERRFRGFSAGLAPIDASTGTLVLYAMEPDKVMNDPDGENSLFMSELLRAMRTPDLSVEAIFNHTRVSVSRASKLDQVPWVSCSLVDDFYFRQPEGTVARQRQPSDTDRLPPARVQKPPVPAERPSAPLSADEKLIQACDDAIQRNPADADAYFKRGRVHARQRQYARAIEDFGQAIRLNPADAEAWNNRCWVRAVVGDLQAGLTDCNEAIRLRANFAEAFDSRGLVHLKLGRPERAIADFDTALRASPRLATALYGRGKAKQAKGDRGGANADLRRATTLDPGIEEEFASYGVR
jgi:tetratricopeptide (TPR) repeat protein